MFFGAPIKQKQSNFIYFIPWACPEAKNSQRRELNGHLFNTAHQENLDAGEIENRNSPSQKNMY